MIIVTLTFCKKVCKIQTNFQAKTRRKAVVTLYNLKDSLSVLVKSRGNRCILQILKHIYIKRNPYSTNTLQQIQMSLAQM